MKIFFFWKFNTVITFFFFIQLIEIIPKSFNLSVDIIVSDGRLYFESTVNRHHFFKTSLHHHLEEY